MVRKLRGPSGNKSAGRAFDRDAQLQAATAAYNDGDLDEATRIYAALAARDPRDATASFLLGLVQHQQERDDDAIASLRRSVKHATDKLQRADASLWWARSLGRLQRAEEAQEVLLAAVPWARDDVTRLYALAEQLVRVNGFDKSEPLFVRVLELSPRHAGALANLAMHAYSARQLERAWDLASSSLQVEPRQPVAQRVLAHLHHELGEVKEAVALYRACLRGVDEEIGYTPAQPVYESLLGALVYADVDDDELRTAHEGWNARFGMNPPPPRLPVRPRGDRPLRVGYVSPDFRNHAVSFFFEPLLHNHDERVVTPILYSNTHKQDEVTERIKAIGTWRDVRGMDEDEIAALVRKDEVDILVELAGYTVDNRMGVFAQRAAPIQINYLGYPCTTGLPTMDYRFTDEDCDPLGETDAVYTEELVRLPGGFYAWRQPDNFPAAAPPPAKKNGFVTFGSLNTLAKISDDVIALWSRLMREVPGSRLILQSDPFAHDWVKGRIRAKFAAHGIDAARVDMHGRMPMIDHLELYNQMDIALDSFPWGGHTTTCMALFMSVPVVTLRGRRMASRMSASALHRMGFDAWIADTAEQYVQIARGLAADVDRLATIRLAQRTVFTSSDLMDGNRLARVIEAAYQAIWDHHAHG